MIVIGIDPHKQTHTAAAVASQTGELRGELTVSARERGHEELIDWARALGEGRLFALEDCRHVSGRLERFLIGSGERVVRVPPKLMGKTRKAARSFGKSDAIDALAVARAALREPDLPAARLAGAELEAKLLLDHREDLVAEATRINNACVGTGSPPPRPGCTPRRAPTWSASGPRARVGARRFAA